jgi:hypothetical protein
MNRLPLVFCGLLIALTLVACGDSKSAAMLDEFEKSVAAMEDKANSGSATFTMDDINEMNRQSADMAEKVKAFQASGEQMSASDMNRYSNLCLRMSSAMTKLSQNMQP